MKLKNLKAFSLLSVCLVFTSIALILMACDTGAGRAPAFTSPFTKAKAKVEPRIAYLWRHRIMRVCPIREQ